jgi:hypothetical protein
MQIIYHTAEDQLKNPNGSPYRHYIILNEEDIDKFVFRDGATFFYREDDKWVHSYSSRSRTPLLRKEYYEWFQETLGPEYSEYWNKIDRIYYTDTKIKIVRYSEDWQKEYGFIDDSKKRWRLDLTKNKIFFKNISDAILFKLTWA